MQGVTGDVSQAVELLPTDRVAMVGFFAPLVAALHDNAKRSANALLCQPDEFGLAELVALTLVVAGLFLLIRPAER